MENFVRLASFVSWKHKVSAISLANAGFTCVNDKAVCINCHVSLDDEKLGNGDFKSYHLAGCVFLEHEPAQSHATSQSQEQSPDLSTIEGRLSTFSRWSSFINPNDLAACGFFYTGTNDKVECVYCKGILHHWCTDDVPLNEHLRHFPECNFAQKLRRDAIRAAANQSNEQRVAAPVVNEVPHIQNIDETIKSLIEDNTRLRESRQCKVCMDNFINTVFLPCGHLTTCDICAARVGECPMCRIKIRGTVKIFLS